MIEMTAPVESGIVVNDLERMVEFYTQGLGCKEAMRADVGSEITKPNRLGEPFTMVWLRPPNGGHIKLLAPREPLERPSLPHLTAQRGLAYLTFYVRDISNVAKRLLELGGTAISDPLPCSVAPGLQVGFIADPEGNPIELAEQT